MGNEHDYTHVHVSGSAVRVLLTILVLCHAREEHRAEYLVPWLVLLV